MCEAMQRDCPDDIETWGTPLIHAYLDVAKPQYEKGIPVCKSIVDRVSNPKTVVDALTVLAECMYPLGKGDEAVAYQDDYYAKHPDLKFEADWVRCRTAYHAEKNWTKAADLLEKLVADYPDRASEPLPMLADALQATGQTQKAAEAIDTLMKTARGQERNDLATRKADIYFAGKMYREAADAYKEIMSSMDTAAEAYGAVLAAHSIPRDLEAKAKFHLATCEWRLGNTAGATAGMLLVIKDYADTKWATYAQEMLQAWGQPCSKP